MIYLYICKLNANSRNEANVLPTTKCALRYPNECRKVYGIEQDIWSIIVFFSISGFEIR